MQVQRNSCGWCIADAWPRAAEQVERVQGRRNQQPVQVHQANDAPGEVGGCGEAAATNGIGRDSISKAPAGRPQPRRCGYNTASFYTPAESDEPPRVPVERSVPRVRHSRPRRQGGPERRRSRRGRAVVRRQPVGREGPGARRRPRQGRRRQARARSRHGAQARRRTCSASAWSPNKPVPKACPSRPSTWSRAPRSSARSISSLTLNREKSKVAVIASAAGGMDIEEVAEHDTGEDPARGHQPHGGPAGLPGAQAGFRPGLQGPAGRAVPEDPARRCTASTSSAMRRCSK